MNMPGIGNERTASPRELLISLASAKWLPGGKMIKGADARDPKNTGDKDVLRSGLLMGKNSSDEYVPSVLGLTAVDTATDSTDLEVEEAAADELERRVGSSGNLNIIGAPTDTGSVAVSGTLGYDSIAVASGGTRVITLSAVAPAVYVDGSFLCADDGSEYPVTLLHSRYGLKVTDEDGSSINVPLSKLLVSGMIKTASVINYPAAALTTLRAWVKAQLRANSIGFVFDDDF